MSPVKTGWSFRNVRLATLLIGIAVCSSLPVPSLAQAQTDNSGFLQGQVETKDNNAVLAVDSDRSNVNIINPEAIRSEQNRKVVLHGVLTKDGFRVISSATIDNRDKPDDLSFAAIVAEHKDAAMVEHLLQLGANPNSETKEGIPALVVAMHMADESLMGNNGHPDVQITTLLLDFGANPDAMNKNWQTPLMGASFVGDEKLAKLFIDHKANVNIGNRFGMTALMYARSLTVLRLLIASGASVNDKSLGGETALYYATQRADPDAVRVLLGAGANANAKNDRGMSPLQLAQLALASDNYSMGIGREEHKKRVQSVIDLLVGAGALLARP